MLRSGTKLTGVSYRSGGESNAGVLSQAVHATFENIAILGALIRDGKLRALAVQSAHRTPLLPDVPTMAEAGVAGRRGLHLLRAGRTDGNAGADHRRDSTRC